MTCPNCSHPMNYVCLDNQNILHCDNCGSSFFEENGINRITFASAEKLASDKKTDEIFGREKLCPNDHLCLKPLSSSEAVPQNISVLKCSRCHGVFAFPDDLLAFKKAQTTKIEFFKAWFKPLPSLRTVLVISFTAIVVGSVFYQLNTFFKNYSQPSQASDLITKINFTRSGRYLLVFFKTKTPMRSKIIFEDKTNGKRTEKTISNLQLTVHQVTISDLSLDDEIWYQIVLTDKQGKETKTEMKKISF